MKVIKDIFYIGCLLIPGISGAAIIDNGDITLDTKTGLEWLDLSFTSNTTYLEDYAAIQSGGSLESWSVASTDQIIKFWGNIWGEELDSRYFNAGDAYLYNGITAAVAGYVGYTLEGTASQFIQAFAEESFHKLRCCTL